MADLLHRPIHTFAPMQEDQKFVAIIRGFPMIFRGETAMQARRSADDFRLVQALLIRGEKFPDELRQKAESAKKRAEARRNEGK